MKKIMLIVAVVVLSNACTKKVDAKKEPVVVQKSQITPELLVQGELYGAGSENILEQNTVITDQNTWDLLVQQMNSVNNFYTSPAIDFSTHQVIAVFTDVKPTGGWAVSITNIEQSATSILVTKSSSGPLGIATTVLTQPFYIVKIPVSNLPIMFN
jgi:hypothetical protein